VSNSGFLHFVLSIITMSFELSSFLEEPQIEEFSKLKKTELLKVGLSCQ